jgi:hypothetical protein
MIHKCTTMFIMSNDKQERSGIESDAESVT